MCVYSVCIFKCHYYYYYKIRFNLKFDERALEICMRYTNGKENKSLKLFKFIDISPKSNRKYVAN